MDFSILYAIQSLRSAFMDSFILGVTKIAGSYGQIWLIIGVLLLIFKKTRKCGFAMIASYVFVFIIGQFVLKDLIARPRPCHIDETIELIIEKPTSFSCPSTHTAWAFAAAASVFCYNRKWGMITGIVALIIAFSRLYLFVHFPTDVLLGVVLGIICALIAVKLVNKVFKKLSVNKRAAM